MIGQTLAAIACAVWIIASIYPRPDDSAVIAQINARVTRLDSHCVVGPTVTRGAVNGRAVADIEMRYAVPLDFIIFRTPPVTLVEARRVFTQPEAS